MQKKDNNLCLHNESASQKALYKKHGIVQLPFKKYCYFNRKTYIIIIIMLNVSTLDFKNSHLDHTVNR